MTDEPHSGSESHPPSGGHEPIDISIRLPLIGGAAILVLCISVIVVLGLSMRYFKSEAKILGLSKPALFKDDAGQFPEPRLQRNTTDDMAKFLAQERAVLESYGWVDAKAGIARIPIDRALELLAERGLPTADTKPKTTEPSQKP
jgi:hypothetical protein